MFASSRRPRDLSDLYFTFEIEDASAFKLDAVSRKPANDLATPS
jgi:hypothetical protein